MTFGGIVHVVRGLIRLRQGDIVVEEMVALVAADNVRKRLWSNCLEPDGELAFYSLGESLYDVLLQ